MKRKKTQYHFLYEKRNRIIALVWLLIIFCIEQNLVFAQAVAPVKLSGIKGYSAGDASKSYNPEDSVFRIVSKNQSVPILYDRNDADVVGISAKALAGDIALITDIKPALETSLKVNFDAAIITGTIGKSKLIAAMIKTGKLSVDTIEGKWESFLIQIVDNPIAGINKALVICGSNPEGTAFGIFELSKRLGISPWVYWADVIPAKRKNLNVAIDKIIMGPPSVKYRGIFLNDEDWGLQPWAARNVDTDIKDIGPHTYAPHLRTYAEA